MFGKALILGEAGRTVLVIVLNGSPPVFLDTDLG